MDYGGASGSANEVGVTLLYDYSRAEDPTHETMEMLEVSEVMKRVGGWSLLGLLLRLDVQWRRSW